MKIIHRLLDGASPSASVIIAVAFMLIFGFLMTRITKKLKLPNVTAYILVGILIGPFVLDLVPATVIEGMDFLSDIAVALIAFSTGEFFRVSMLRRNGAKAVLIAMAEAAAAALLVFLLTHFVLGLRPEISAVLTALAAITAPTSTMMIIRQTGAKGEFVDTLLPAIALDELIGLLGYSAAVSFALMRVSSRSFGVMTVLFPILSNLASLLLGGIFGGLLMLMMKKKHSTDNRLIIALSLLFAFCGVCALFDVSPLLGCMSMGTVYINLTGDDKLFKQINYFSPPIMLLFFVRSGLNFRLDAITASSAAVGKVPLLAVALLYALVRMIGKYAGAFLGCHLTHASKKTRTWLGLSLVPQAGVTIGLAALAARSIGGESGEALQTVILTSGIFYELIGPALSKLALSMSGACSNKLEDLVPTPETAEGVPASPLEMLIARIQVIQRELPRHENEPSEEEKAFSEAAEEEYAALSSPVARRNKSRFFRQ